MIALKHKNFTLFTRILQKHEIDLENVALDFEYSAFERCCMTAGSGKFIKQLIKRGCNVNKVKISHQTVYIKLKIYFQCNGKFPNKIPINFAAESKSLDNIKAVLEGDDVLIDNIFEGKTPIQYLASEINDDNFDEISQCIRHLIASNADVNIPDDRGMNIILTLAEKTISRLDKFTELLQHILDCPGYFYRFCDEKAMQELTKKFPQLKLPGKNTNRTKRYFLLLASLLKERKEQAFIDSLNEFFEQSKDDADANENILREHPANETLLMIATRHNLFRAVEVLMRHKDSSLDRELYSKLETSPFELACKHGHHKILRLFLKMEFLNRLHGDVSNISFEFEKCLLTVFIKIVEENSADYHQCFQQLLNIPNINLNYKYETCNRSTLLHLAVRNNEEPVILDLLKRGANINIRNDLGMLPIYDIAPGTLEKHLNHCITTNGLPPTDEYYNIIFKHNNFLSNQAISDKGDAAGSGMDTIEYIAKSEELKHLVQHPLIASYLFLKWKRLSISFYINFFCYAMYFLSIISFLLFRYGTEKPHPTLHSALLSLCVIGGLYVLIRELSQFILSPGDYVKSFENWLEVALIVMTILVLVPKDDSFDRDADRAISALTILLAVAEFFVLTGSLPVLSFSTHLVMLTTVSKNVLKTLILYSIILFAFAFCFYILLGKDNEAFIYPGLAIIKTGKLSILCAVFLQSPREMDREHQIFCIFSDYELNFKQKNTLRHDISK